MSGYFELYISMKDEYLKLNKKFSDSVDKSIKIINQLSDDKLVLQDKLIANMSEYESFIKEHIEYRRKTEETLRRVEAAFNKI